MRCSKCEFENPEGMKFCGQCTNPLALICPKCNFENPPGFKFCGQCTAPLSLSEVKATSSTRIAEAAADQEVVDGERKTVTALFADIKGSTELMEDLDPEEARAIVDPALKLMIEAVRRYDGYVVQSTGDGIFALFGAPVAHEDHPQRALYASLQMQNELREHGQRRAAEGRAALEARIGVNTGEVVVRSLETGGKIEYTPIGHTANLASRLQTMAPPGSIAVSEHTCQLVEGYFELRALGPMAIRGISEAINVYAVTGLGSLRTHFELSVRRGLTKFVGRESDLERMKRTLDQVMDGHGQVVAVMAEAGTGKSRLFHEFKATLPSECKLLEAYSVSHGKGSAWLPVLELLRGYFGVTDTDDVASRREKVRAVLGALDAAFEGALPYLFGLLGIQDTADPLAQMAPEVKRQRTLDAIKRIVLRESLKQPVVVLFEDLHWIDAQTQALLDLVADSIANTHVLLLVNYRPEYHHEWANKSYYSQLRLDPLGGAEGAAMLGALLGESVELNPIKRLIAERTAGNPFFIEEIVQALFDEGALVRNGAVKITRSLSQLRLPPTVQGILASRIDRQPSEHKQLLQTLAVMGRESTLGLIRQVTYTTEAQLERMLADLQAVEFIYEQSAASGVEYVFKHALTQEVAYNSLLIERRKLLHGHAGEALESMFPEQLDDHISELARHYSHSDNVDKAIEYLGRAGQQAMERSAYVEALSHLTKTLELLNKLPDASERAQEELMLQATLAQALQATKGWSDPGAGNAYARSLELCRQMGDSAQLSRALRGLWGFNTEIPRLGISQELAEQNLRLAQKTGDRLLLAEAHLALGFTLFFRGEIVSAQEHLKQGIASDSSPQIRSRAVLYGYDMRAPCWFVMACALWMLGYPDQALKRGEETLAFAQELDHPYTSAVGLYWAATFHRLRREKRATQRRAEDLMALCTEQGFMLFQAFGAILGGSVRDGQEREQGIGQIRRGLAAHRATGGALRQPFWLALLGECYRDIGNIEEALIVLDDALSVSGKTEERWYEAELNRLKGELLLMQNFSSGTEAEHCFRVAIEIALKQKTKSLELRATSSLARLLASQGHRDEARTMLADIYGWFTEGFDTADLKDAKTLLVELRG